MKKNIGQKLAGEALDKVWRDVYNQEKDLEKKKSWRETPTATGILPI